MTTDERRQAAQGNIKKAQDGARSKHTLKNLPKSTRTALRRAIAEARA